MRATGPRGSKWNRLPMHSSRTATDTVIPRGLEHAQRRAASCTAAPNRSSWSLTGSPALIPMRTSSAASWAFSSCGEASLHRDRSFDCTRHRGERGHDAVAGVLHLSPVVHRQRVTHDPVVLVEQRNRPVVAESFGHLRRTADVGEQHRSHRRCRVGRSDRMLGKRTEERLNRPGLDLDDVVGKLAVRLAMNLLDRLDARPFGQTEHRPRILARTNRSETEPREPIGRRHLASALPRSPRPLCPVRRVDPCTGARARS